MVKNKTVRRWISALLIFLQVVMLLPTVSFAASSTGASGSAVHWTQKNTLQYTISMDGDYTGKSGDYLLYDSLSGKRVSDYKPAIRYVVHRLGGSITPIAIPDGRDWKSPDSYSMTLRGANGKSVKTGYQFEKLLPESTARNYYQHQATELQYRERIPQQKGWFRTASCFISACIILRRQRQRDMAMTRKTKKQLRTTTPRYTP